MSFSLPLPMLSPLLASVAPQAISIYGFITNSIIVALLVLVLIFWFTRKATANMTLVPHKAQNFFELIIEFLYNQLEAIMGPKLATRAFPLLGTLFIYILVSNLFGLFPGVGTIGWGDGIGPLSVSEVHEPLLRPATADMNTTVGLALAWFLMWMYLTISEVGVWGFIVHTFGPKGGLKGVMGFLIAIVFLFVGVIEVVSIIIRPVTLSIRLYGNIYAGESVLHSMMSLLDKAGAPWNSIGSVLLPLPFYFMEILVALLQAIVFTLLCAVYIQLSATHEEHKEDGAHH